MRTILSKQAQKFLEKIENEIYYRIINRIKELEQDPYKGDIKHLTDTNLYRARIGDYRIIFNINNQTIEIVKIEHRSKIY